MHQEPVSPAATADDVRLEAVSLAPHVEQSFGRDVAVTCRWVVIWTNLGTPLRVKKVGCQGSLNSLDELSRFPHTRLILANHLKSVANVVARRRAPWLSRIERQILTGVVGVRAAADQRFEG